MNKKQAKEILKGYLAFHPIPIDKNITIYRFWDKNICNEYTYEYIKKIADGK